MCTQNAVWCHTNTELKRYAGYECVSIWNINFVSKWLSTMVMAKSVHIKPHKLQDNLIYKEFFK